MGDARLGRAGKPRPAGACFELEDYILARMDLMGLSVRGLALLANIGRSRLHHGLHREVELRVSLKWPEIAAVLEALNIDIIEAMFAKEIFRKNAGVEFNDLLKVISMVCNLVDGLPEQIITVVKHVDGLCFDDVRPEHGDAAQGLVVRAVEKEYNKIAKRRSDRFNGFGAE